jgi:hypothetical protein
MVSAIQRTYDGGCDPNGEREISKSEQVKQCMDLEHCLHCLHCLRLEPTDQYYTAYYTLATLGAVNPSVRYCLHSAHTGYTRSPLTSISSPFPYRGEREER